MGAGNRWPWIALGLGVLVVAAVAVTFFINRTRSVDINLQATPNAVARSASPSAGAPPTLVAPAAPTSAALATAPPTATVAPSPTATVVLPTPTPVVVAASPIAQTAPPPATAAPVAVAVAPTAPPASAAASPVAAAPPPTPQGFNGQVSSGGGLGNTRQDLDAAYGPPAGETPEHLVAYRKNNFEYHVQLVPDINGRAAMIVIVPQNSSQPLTLEAAAAEAHRLLPNDAQPPNPQQEGNTQFVVERYTSQTLAQALPAQAQSGQLMAVYARDPSQSGRITRVVIGPGNDPGALLNAGR